MQRRRDVEQLVITAPVSGEFWPAVPRSDRQDDSGQLRTWVGSPTDRQNVGALLDRQTRIGQIVDEQSQFQAILMVDQKDIEFVGPGQKTSVWIRQLPGKSFKADVQLVSTAKIRKSPNLLSIVTAVTS
ncbi:MAG: HlyD family efflux transporter periplasmic adaptor subunit [Pirellulaceae bacterium]